MENEFMKRGYLLPDGCKDLIDALKLKQQKHSLPALPFIAPGQWAALNPSPEILKKWDALKAFKAAAAKVPIKGVLVIPAKTSLSQLAAMLGQKPFQIIAELMKLGFFLFPNDAVSFETASLIARKHGFLAKRADE